LAHVTNDKNKNKKYEKHNRNGTKSARKNIETLPD
jgi:hypothetical protein